MKGREERSVMEGARARCSLYFLRLLSGLSSSRKA